MQKEWLREFYQYMDDFRYYSYRLDTIPWLYRTILYLPIGMLIENYWLNKMSKCNKDYEQKWLNK